MSVSNAHGAARSGGQSRRYLTQMATQNVPATDAASPKWWGTTASVFIGFAAVVATGYSTSAWSVGPVTGFDQSDSREDLANRIDSKVVEHIACHIGKGRCNLIKHDPEKCDETQYSSSESHLEQTQRC